MEKQKFTYNFTVEATTKEESVKILTALTSLTKSLVPDDLTGLANAINKNPGLIKKAKLLFKTK